MHPSLLVGHVDDVPLVVCYVLLYTLSTMRLHNWVDITSGLTGRIGVR